MRSGDDSYEAIGERLVELRAGKVQAWVAHRLGVSVSAVCRAEKGQELSARTAERYDRVFATGGEISARRAALRRGGRAECRHGELAALAEAGGGVVVVMPLPGGPELAAELLTGMAGGRTLSPPDGSYRVIVSAGEVADADRRGLFQAAGGAALAGVLDEVEQASRAITAAQPDPWTLTELAEDAVTIAARYYSTPPDRLVPDVVARWRQCRDMLDGSPLGAPGLQVIRLAGHFAYYAARAGADTGNHRLASGFGALAEQYADVSGDPLLIGSVACFRSCRAFDVAHFDEAADIAGRAVGQAHPYTRARLFAYQAHALAAGGRPDNARDALADMRGNMVDLPPMPGPSLFDEVIEVLYSAMVLADIGDRDAEIFAREAITGMPADGYHQAHASAWVTVGKARAARDPGYAADAGLRALEVNRAWPDLFVENRARQLHRTLAREHGQVAEVARLGEAVKALRPVATA